MDLPVKFILGNEFRGKPLQNADSRCGDDRRSRNGASKVSMRGRMLAIWIDEVISMSATAISSAQIWERMKW
jgi:hypothetical protein